MLNKHSMHTHTHSCSPRAAATSVTPHRHTEMPDCPHSISASQMHFLPGSPHPPGSSVPPSTAGPCPALDFLCPVQKLWEPWFQNPVLPQLRAVTPLQGREPRCHPLLNVNVPASTESWTLQPLPFKVLESVSGLCWPSPAPSRSSVI